FVANNADGAAVADDECSFVVVAEEKLVNSTETSALAAHHHIAVSRHYRSRIRVSDLDAYQHVFVDEHTPAAGDLKAPGASFSDTELTLHLPERIHSRHHDRARCAVISDRRVVT